MNPDFGRYELDMPTRMVGMAKFIWPTLESKPKTQPKTKAENLTLCLKMALFNELFYLSRN